MARHAGLDAAKTLAVVFVVATHAALSYMVTPIGWAVQDTSRSIAVDLCVWIARGAGMPVFFWLSGYFARDVYERRGPVGFLGNRARRILVPLALAIVPCSLALDALWDRGRELFNRPEVAATIPKLEGSKLPLTLGHLWYLYYLLIISVVMLAIVGARQRSRLRIPTWLAPAVAIVPLVRVGNLQLDTPLGFAIDPWVTIYFGAFFAWGWLVHARPATLERYADHGWRYIAAAAVLLAAVLPALVHATTPSYAIVASGAFTIAMVAAFLGLCVRHVRRPRFQLASDASYWTYIVHLPLVVLLQLGFATVTWPGPIEYLAILAATACACLVSYVVLARARRWLATFRRATDSRGQARSADTP